MCRRVTSHLSSARKPCATLPVINARSTCSGASVDVSPRIRTTLSSPGSERATANDASAGSTPTAGLVRFRDFLPAVRRVGVQSNTETRCTTAGHASQALVGVALSGSRECGGHVRSPSGHLPESVDGGRAQVRVGVVKQIERSWYPQVLSRSALVLLAPVA